MIEIAKKMILDWGMSPKLGLINYTSDDRRILPMELPGKEYSDSTAELIDAEIRAIIDDAEKTTRELIQANRDKLERIAEALLTYETLDADEVQRIMAGERLEKPSVNELIEKERSKAAPAKAPQPPPKQAPGVGPVPQPG